MSSIKAQHDISSDNDYDKDDFISFQYESQTIDLYYTHLSKYSRLIRKEYLYSDVQNRLPQDLHNLQKQFNIDSANIYHFFKLLQEDFTINQKLSFKQYTDFFKISEFLQSTKITKKLTDHFNTQKLEIDLAIQIILYEIENSNNTESNQFQIDKQMEEILSEKVNECFQNEKFAQLPLFCQFRIIEKCDMKKLSTDLLYDFIKTDLNKFNILFSFIDLQKLSDERLNDLYECYSKNSNKPLFSFLKCNLDYIMELRESKKSVQDKLTQYEKMNSLLNNEKNDLLNKLKDMESENSQTQQKLDQIEKEKKSIEIEKTKLLKKINELENQNKSLIEEIDSHKIIGEIEAKVKSQILFNAEIKLKENKVRLDTSRSKYIVSSSNSKTLGENEYRNGEPITSNNLTTLDFAAKSGTYYVRAFVVANNGKAIELISNPVTISGQNLPFTFEGKPRQVLLAKGKYKLEVWGGEGGSSTGIRNCNAEGKGGKGGYSSGIISLTKLTKLFIYVGGQGKSAKQENGAETEGAFPDGGGTMTGHESDKYTTVPGTGGGSTSIRVSSDSLYSRVIVAGGGGGADSDYDNTNNGGYGGGSTGCNGCYQSILQNQGAGTQTGSTPGPKGSHSKGVAGTFGKGATSEYNGNRNTGGGGGGGWYGGGSGGLGNGVYSTSGGGGSGWIFTESSFNLWKSGDSANANQFQLDSSLYLTDATTISGNSSFPSPIGNDKETGHSGNGYAKITPQD